MKNIQGERLGPGGVALTMKHFPGGGAQAGGADSHYAFGKNQSHPSGDLAYQLKPFRAAIAAGVSSIMPAYGIPVGTKYAPNDVGMAFSKGLLTALLRDTLGFDGNLNSDTGIIGTRAWGLESKTVDEQIAFAVNAGVDVLSGFESNQQIVGIVKSGKISAARLDDAVKRLLTEQFRLGLFEDPYVDPDRAAYLVGNRAFQMRAEEAQRKSIVLLQNQGGLLPLRVEDIQAVMREVGAGKTILAIYFRQPYVLDEASGFRNAGAILATFGVRDAAIMDVLTGQFKPSGKLPFALAGNAQAVVRQASDAPGYDRADTLFPFGFGLRY